MIRRVQTTMTTKALDPSEVAGNLMGCSHLLRTMNGSILECARAVRAIVCDRYALRRNHALGGYCAHASLALRDALEQLGFGAVFVCGTHDDANHCWVECGGMIVDITATQFGRFAHVRIVRIDHPSYLAKFCDDVALNLVRSEWPWMQVPR